MIEAGAHLAGERAETSRRQTGRIGRLVAEIDALIDADETTERQIHGAWKTFDDINAAAAANAWDAYSVDLTVDAASYRSLERRKRHALLRIFGTIYRAESIVDDWMVRIVAAVPRENASMRAALQGQEHDEKMHRGSLFRAATEIFGIAPGDVERVAQKYNNFVAETLFARFNVQMAQLLRSGRPIEDVYTAIFIYGILSEDVVANSDVVIRRAKGNDKYAEFNMPGMREGQTNVRRDEGRHVRIAVLATHAFLDSHPGAEETLTSTCREYLDLADTMLRQAKRSGGLIDAHLRESYGADVDSLYYYLVNMKRLAVRLDELGLRDVVRDIGDRVDAAVEEFTDGHDNPVVHEPGALARAVGPAVIRLAKRAGL
jgi:hypothetical protein